MRIRDLLIIAGIVLLLRLPFLNQAVQGDDVYYLAGAQYAQTDPLHPSHARYLFLGREVTMQGHPHPPLNVWILAGLLALLGDIREVPFHAAYILFSLAAAFSAYALALRFSRRPLLATLLLLAVPAFVVNGNSLEADLPFLALWLASIALFIAAVDARCGMRLAFACLAMALAALAAYQALLLVPILGIYLWLRRKDWLPGWLALGAAPFTLAAWQLYERLTSGAAPLSVTAGYFQSYALQTLSAKGLNALALTAHTAWILFPLLALAAFRPKGRALWAAAGVLAATGAVWDWNPLFWGSLGVGALVLIWALRQAWETKDPDTRFLALWVVVFFASALVIFFAGSARYLLPMALPLALLAVRSLENRPRWLLAGMLLQMALGLALSAVNYQHWDGYRQFAVKLRRETESRRVWINGEWGLRYYFERDGGLPVRQGQILQPGEMVVSSDLSFPVSISTGGNVLIPVAETEIRSSLPFRLVGLSSRSGYSSVAWGLRPFDLRRDPIDRVRASLVQERQPTLSYVEMNSPEAEQHILGGVYQLEEGRWRWMGQQATLLLKPPQGRAVAEVSLFIPDTAPARRITVSLDGKPLLERTVPGPGPYTLTSAPVEIDGPSTRLTISVDRTFSAPGDQRVLGVVLIAAGLKK